MKLLRVERFGEDNIVQGVMLRGDPRNPEPESFRITFPFGDVEVVRATDEAGGDYWVHVRVNDPDAGTYRADGSYADGGRTGLLKAARLDIRGRHTADVNVGEFADPSLYHLAVRVGAKP